MKNINCPGSLAWESVIGIWAESGLQQQEDSVTVVQGWRKIFSICICICNLYLYLYMYLYLWFVFQKIWGTAAAVGGQCDSCPRMERFLQNENPNILFCVLSSRPQCGWREEKDILRIKNSDIRILVLLSRPHFLWNYLSTAFLSPFFFSRLLLPFQGSRWWKQLTQTTWSALIFG